MIVSSGDFLVLVILVKIKYKWILVQSWFTLCTNVINLWEVHFGYGRYFPYGSAFHLWEVHFSYDYVHERGGIVLVIVKFFICSR